MEPQALDIKQDEKLFVHGKQFQTMKNFRKVLKTILYRENAVRLRIEKNGAKPIKIIVNTIKASRSSQFPNFVFFLLINYY